MIKYFLMVILMSFSISSVAMSIDPETKALTMSEAEAKQLVAEFTQLMQANKEMYNLLIKQEKKLETCKDVTKL